jgi:glycosyltransferase involved in cell wall biosynthesis
MRDPCVVQVSAYYPPHLGGQEIAVQDLSAQLALTGRQVWVVTSDCGSRAGISIEHGVPVVRLKSREFAHTPVIWGLFFWLLRHTRSDTIVHLHVGQFFTPEMVWAAAKIRHFKYVIHMHCDLVASGTMGRLLPLYKRLFLGREIRAAEAAVVLNNEHRRALRHDYHYDGNLVMLSNGIPEEFFRIRRRPARGDGLRLLFVGRLSPHKNVTALLEALGTVGQGITVDIIGDGECRTGLELTAEAKGLKNARFHGRLGRGEIMAFYATADAIVLPSLYEVQPMVLLEAMASRLPVITTEGLGMNLGPHEAILIEPTVQGIVAGIERFTAMSPAARKSLADAAFERAQELSWPTLITAYTRLYEGAIKCQPRRWLRPAGMTVTGAICGWPGCSGNTAWPGRFTSRQRTMSLPGGICLRYRRSEI